MKNYLPKLIVSLIIVCAFDRTAGQITNTKDCRYKTIQNDHFNFRSYLIDQIPTIYLWIEEINYTTGVVNMNGVDMSDLTGPFTWEWGDGNINNGWFPQQHRYTNLSKNFIIRVTSHYAGGTTGSAEVLIRFVPPSVDPQVLPSELEVTIPNNNITLISRNPPAYYPPQLTYFDESFFTTVSRSTVEYILSLVAVIEMDFVNDDVFLINNSFKQVVLRSAEFEGMFSIWFTDPVAFASGDYGFQGNIGWSSFFHEMGHNFTLNSPADFFFGGKIDGNANAIFSESMAQIFQHAVAYEMINHYTDYGISEDLIFEIKQSAISSIKVVREYYESYIKNGTNFFSWNNPVTQEDETVETFMTIAFKFFLEAESSGLGYRNPLKRMMELLQIFNEDLHYQYDQFKNNAAADTLRATLLITAMSYGFSTDLREYFRRFNFPVSDQIYDNLMSLVYTGINNSRISSHFLVDQNYPNSFNTQTTIPFKLKQTSTISLNIYDINGQLIKSVSNDQEWPSGSHNLMWDGTNDQNQQVSSGLYIYRLETENYSQNKKCMLVR